jgi:hypothetical protein
VASPTGTQAALDAAIATLEDVSRDIDAAACRRIRKILGT